MDETRQDLPADILERVSDGLVALDKHWHYTYVNRQAAQLFGRTPQELIGKHIWTEFPEGVGQPFHLAYEKAMAEQAFIEMENYYEPWDRWFENRIYPSPEGLSIFFHEITERKRAERAAQESAELLKGQNRVLELIARDRPLQETLDLLLRLIEGQCSGMLSSILLLDPDGVHVRHGAAPSLPESFIRRVDGECIGPKAGSCGTAAFRRESVIVEDIVTDCLWDDYRELALSHGLRACWSTPIFDGERQVLGTFALYFRVPGRPTERHWHLIEISTYTAAIAIVKYRESEALHRRETQLAEAQRIAELGSYEWDIATNKVSRSQELCRIFGLPREQFAPTFEGYLERVHPEDRSSTREIIETSFRELTPFEFEERIVQPGGAIRLLRSRGKWILDNSGKPVRLVGICQDITERRRAQDQLRMAELLRARNEELKAFAYTVSHDLKAPLRGIAGYAQELNRRHRSGLSERGLECLKQILNATQNLDRLIEDLLRYSRLDAEVVTGADVDVARLVETILKDRQPIITERQIEIELQLSTACVRTWERGLQQVLTNVIDNAIKYTRDAHPPRIQISSQEFPDRFQITVVDNGIGFDMKHHDRIFGLFNRLVAADDFEGTGAGLAIVKKLMEKLRGKVWAKSQPGSGAQFFIELPKTDAG
jgi:PAS domain S-box-containing protein